MQPDLLAVRVWIGAGTNDPIIPVSETNALAELLRNAGADVTIRYFQAGHELTMADVEAAKDWLTLLGRSFGGHYDRYLRAKVAQEKLIQASAIPYTIMRATQFFEFVGRIADSATTGQAVHLPSVLFQPIFSDDLAAAVARIAVAEPLNGQHCLPAAVFFAAGDSKWITGETLLISGGLR